MGAIVEAVGEGVNYYMTNWAKVDLRRKLCKIRFYIYKRFLQIDGKPKASKRVSAVNRPKVTQQLLEAVDHGLSFVEASGAVA